MQGPDIKHLRAVVALAEERHFSRAARRLRIGQSGLTKQVSAVEAYLGFALFTRGARLVTPTPAGEIFVAEAKLALQHLDRAINLSRASSGRAGLTVHVGRSPYTDPYLITKLLSLHLPLYPEVRFQLSSKLAYELASDVLEGTLDLAFVTGMPDTPGLTGTVVADQLFWIAMSEDDSLAMDVEVNPADLHARSFIILERHVQPRVYDDFVRLVKPASSPGCNLHHVMTAEDALQLILRGFGLAVLSQSNAWRILQAGVTIRPLRLPELSLQTRVVARSDNASKLISDVVRSLVRSLDKPLGAQIQLPLRA